MALTQFIINLRYSLMAISLSQRVDASFTVPARLLLGFSITDEIFAVASSQPGKVSHWYLYGLMTAPYLGWSVGTILGAVAGTLLPVFLRNALGIAIFGMFLAIIIPPARKNKVVAALVALSFALSFACNYLPGIASLSDGTRTILLTVLISCGAALLFPVENDAEEAAQ